MRSLRTGKHINTLTVANTNRVIAHKQGWDYNHPISEKVYHVSPELRDHWALVFDYDKGDRITDRYDARIAPDVLYKQFMFEFGVSSLLDRVHWTDTSGNYNEGIIYEVVGHRYHIDEEKFAVCERFDFLIPWATIKIVCSQLDKLFISEAMEG